MDDMQELKSDVKELLQRSAVHNELLRTHEARSLALQEGQKSLDVRIKPIETHVHFVNLFLKLFGTICTGGLVYLLGQLLIRHLLR